LHGSAQTDVVAGPADQDFQFARLDGELHGPVVKAEQVE
jgi:hypothetical protein